MKSSNNHLFIADSKRGDIHENLLENDTLVTVQGYRVSNFEEVETLLDNENIGAVATVTVKRGDMLVLIPVTLTPYYDNTYITVIVIAGVIFLFVGIYVFLRRPDDPIARLFHWVSVFAACLIFWTWGKLTIAPIGFGHLLRILFNADYAFLPVLFTHFTFMFPRPKWARRRLLLIPMYAIALILTIAQTVSFLGFVIEGSEPWLQATAGSFRYCIIFFIAGMVIAAGNFIHSYYSEVDEFERRKLRLVLYGVVVGPLCFSILWQLPNLLRIPPLVREEVVILISVLAPVSFAISIVRYSMFQIDFFLNRSTVYTLVLFFMLGVYAGVDLIIYQTVQDITFFWLVVVSALAFFVDLVLFQPARGIVQKFVDRTFFRVRYDFRTTQMKFIDQIKQCYTVQQIADVIVSRTEEFIPVQRIGLFLFQMPSQLLRLYAHHNFDAFVNRDLRVNPLRISWNLRLPLGVSKIVEPGTQYEAANEALFQRLNISLVFPILSERGSVFGYIVLGRKKSGARFSAEDLDLLNTAAMHAGMTIDRIELHKRLALEHAEAERLQELNKLKSYFVSSVSHELKTPLTSIKLYAELLQSSPVLSDKKKLEYLDIIQGESERLTRLINNVLDYAKIEHGVKEYSLYPIDLNCVVRNTLEVMSYQFSIERFVVSSHLLNDELVILADPDAVEEALINILTNALKYSQDRKEIIVSIGRTSGYATVAVSDYGIGIMEKELITIFQPFKRGSGSRSEKLPGTGLGLALVKHIMDAHKGEVTVKSVPMEGSTFTLYFPLSKEQSISP